MKRKLIKVPIPKEIWDASTSIFGGSKIFKAWIKSIQKIKK